MSTRTRIHLVAVVLGLLSLAWPPDSSALLIWRKGEGWSFDRGGATAGRNPKEQLEIAKKFHAEKNYGAALDAYRRLVKKWPTSFAAEEAQLGLADCLSAVGYQYKAFKEYQNLIQKYPNTTQFDVVLQRQFEIGNLFLGGEKHKMLGMKIFPAMDKTVEVFEQVVKNGPYSKLGPPAQLRIGWAHEKQRDYLSAIRAYEKLIERYPQDQLAAMAQFAIGMAYKQEAKRSEYDQNMANQAIAAFADYLTRYPKGENAALATQYLSEMQVEQARGLYQIGQFYEKQRNVKAALLYYNEVIEKSPKSDWGKNAQQKVAALTPSGKS